MGAGSAHEHVQAPMQSSVNWALLGLIIERPSYAYELAQRFERTYDGAIALSSVSHVYTALANLRERALIEEMPGTGPGVRSRRRYRATKEGLAEHGEWLVGQVAVERRRQRVLIAQLGALARTPARAIEILDEYEQACLAEIAAAPAGGQEQEGPGTTRLVARLAGEESRLSVAAKLKWVQYARAQLQAHRPALGGPQPPTAP
jgi:DNA-binding PadR family transcriptional regulator